MIKPTTAEALDELTVELTGVRSDLRSVATRQGWIIVALVVVGALFAAAVVVGTIAVSRFSANDRSIRSAVVANNRLLCPAIRLLANPDPPRTTKAGQVQVEEFQRLMRSPQYNC